MKPTNSGRHMAPIDQIRNLTNQLSQLRAAKADLLSQKQTHSAEARAIGEQISAAGSRLETQIADFARNHAGLPNDPFPEEQEMERLKRQLLVILARARLLDPPIAQKQEQIEGLVKAVEEQWTQFGLSGLADVRQRFRDGIETMRELYIEQIAWIDAFRGFPGAKITVMLDLAHLVDPEGKIQPLDRDDLLFQGAWKRTDVGAEWHRYLAELRQEIDTATKGA